MKFKFKNEKLILKNEYEISKDINYSYDLMSDYNFEDFKKQLEKLSFDNKSILYITSNKEA